MNNDNPCCEKCAGYIGNGRGTDFIGPKCLNVNCPCHQNTKGGRGAGGTGLGTRDVGNSPAMEKCECGQMEYCDVCNPPTPPTPERLNCGHTDEEHLAFGCGNPNATPETSWEWEEGIRRSVIGSLKSCKDAHGKVDVSSAEKRVVHGLREPIATLITREREEEYKRCLAVLEREHTNCPIPQSCIGYQNALSDLMNNPPLID